MLIRLHPDLTLTGRILFDRTLGVQYKVSHDASQLLRYMHQEVSVERIVHAVAGAQSIPARDVRSAVYALIGYLDTYGGVIVRDDSPYEWLRRVRLSGWRIVRYPGTWRGFMHSMARAYGALALIATVTFVSVQIASGAILPEGWAVIPALLLASCIAHEAGHALAARYEQVPQIFLSKPGFAAVMYARPKQGRERCIAGCGPLCAGVLCVVAAILISGAAAKAVCLAVGLIHLGSFLPWTADGKTFWRKL